MGPSSFHQLERELAFAEWEEDQVDTDPEHAASILLARYAGYANEGHLCVAGYLDEFGPGGRWVAWCANCKVSTLGTLEEVVAAASGADVEGSVLTWTEAKLWTRRHRAEYGLPKQETGPVVNIFEKFQTVGGTQ